VTSYLTGFIRKISPSGVYTEIVSNNGTGFVDGIGTGARFNTISGLTIDSDGIIYASDYYDNSIKKIVP
jgi:hypothetical protein